jgi:hypothetical protein
VLFGVSVFQVGRAGITDNENTKPNMEKKMTEIVKI